MTTLQNLLQTNNYNLFKVGEHDLKEAPASIPQDVQKRVSMLAVPCYTLYLDEARFKIALDIRVGAALSRLEAARLAFEFNGDPDAEEHLQDQETQLTITDEVVRTTAHTHNADAKVRWERPQFDTVGNTTAIDRVTAVTEQPTQERDSTTDTTNPHNVTNTVGPRREVRQKIMSPHQAHQRREAYNAEVFDCLTEILRGAIYEGQCFR